MGNPFTHSYCRTAERCFSPSRGKRQYAAEQGGAATQMMPSSHRAAGSASAEAEKSIGAQAVAPFKAARSSAGNPTYAELASQATVRGLSARFAAAMTATPSSLSTRMAHMTSSWGAAHANEPRRNARDPFLNMPMLW